LELTFDAKSGSHNRARRQILSLIPYERVRKPKVHLPKRSSKDGYDDELDFSRVELVLEHY
jgi:hypothetical protein